MSKWSHPRPGPAGVGLLTPLVSASRTPRSRRCRIRSTAGNARRVAGPDVLGHWCAGWDPEPAGQGGVSSYAAGLQAAPAWVDCIGPAG